jgi:hypothetical protein
VQPGLWGSEAMLCLGFAAVSQLTDRGGFFLQTPLPADIAEHVRMDIKTDISHVIKMLAGHEPDDLADLPFGICGSKFGI